jgi:hypothetical protein
MDERWSSENLTSMLSCLRGQERNRKLRLFACACCRRIERLIYPPWDQVLEAAEHHADGLLDYRALQAIRSGADPVHDETMAVEAAAMSDSFPIKNADDAAGYAAQAVASEISPGYPQNLAAWQEARGQEELGQCAILRDIFGNPFHAVAVDPRWLTATVFDLARLIYDGRAFDRLPIFADALMDAGCENDDILAHCHSEGPHVRGCWVIDLILGKQ